MTTRPMIVRQNNDNDLTGSPAMTASVTAMTPNTDTESLLVARAERLRVVATDLHPVLAQTYRRRAAELKLEAWARAARVAPTEVDAFTSVAA